MHTKYYMLWNDRNIEHHTAFGGGEVIDPP